VLIEEAHLPGPHEAVTGDLGVPVADDELGTLDVELDARADEGPWDAVSRRAEAHGAQVVDGPRLDRPDGRACRGQRSQDAALDREPLVGHGGGLGVDPPVHLGAPSQRGGVRCLEAGEGSQAHEEVGLGVADEVLDDALALGVRGLAEVGSEAVVGGEGDIALGGHDDVGHDAALQATHPVGQDDAGHPAEELETLGEQGEGRGLVLPLGEADEAPATPGEDGTEDLPGSLLAPVDDEVLARDGLPGAIAASASPVLGLRRCHGTTEAPC
jgi:hypothetical protein